MFRALPERKRSRRRFFGDERCIAFSPTRGCLPALEAFREPSEFLGRRNSRPIKASNGRTTWKRRITP